jgi:hypothetical protein
MKNLTFGHLQRDGAEVFWKHLPAPRPLRDLKSINPNPGGLVANMTSKTLNCCVKFIIHKKFLKNAWEGRERLNRVSCKEEIFFPTGLIGFPRREIRTATVNIFSSSQFFFILCPNL